MALSDEELSRAVEKQSHSILGRITVEPGRTNFRSRSSGPTASPDIASRWSAKSAHVRAADRRPGPQHGSARCRRYRRYRRVKRLALGEDPGAPHGAGRYAAARRADVASRTFVIDIANRSLLQDFLPVQTRAPPACICSARSVRCGVLRCARGSRRPGVRWPRRADAASRCQHDGAAKKSQADHSAAWLAAGNHEDQPK